MGRFGFGFVILVWLSHPSPAAQAEAARCGVFACRVVAQNVPEGHPAPVGCGLFLRAYEGRNALSISVAPTADDRGRPNGSLHVFSDANGFFSFDFWQAQPVALPPGELPTPLRGARFAPRAASQSQFGPTRRADVGPPRDGDFARYANRSNHPVISLLTAGEYLTRDPADPGFDDLLARCPADGSIGHHFESPEYPIEVRLTKAGGRLREVFVKTPSGEGTGTYDAPIASPEEAFTATVVTKSKKFPDGLRLRVEKRPTVTDPAEVRRVYRDALSQIPDGTTLLLNSRDDPIPVRWDAESLAFRPVALPEAVRTAGEQRLVARDGSGSGHWVAAGVGGVALVLGVVWLRRRRRALAGVMVLLAGSGLRAQTEDGPYSGLYCVRAAAAATGRSVEFEQLRQRKYLSTSSGSTADDLCAALRLAGLRGVPRSHIDVSRLRALGRPVILRVRPPGVEGVTTWALFLGFASLDSVSLYDPPFPQREVRIAELLAAWDGSGVEVTEEGEASFAPPGWDWAVLTLFAGGALLALRRRLGPRLAIPAAAFLLALAWGWTPQGPLGKPRAAGLVAANHFGREFPVIDFDTFWDYQRRGGASLVDARTAEDFAAARIPGTVSVPVNAGFGQLQDVARSLPTDRPVVCFCASERCGWADRVANQLSHMGFRHVSLYRGGVQEWFERNQPVQR